MKELFEKINLEKNIVVSGDMLSGKTTNVLFPLFKKIVDDNENVIVYDTKDDYLNNYYDELIEKGYNVRIINLRNIDNSEGWNPLELAYAYYKNGNVDKSIEILENISSTLYPVSKNLDPFWTNMASDFFVGICLTLFENNDESVINMNSVDVFTTVGEEKAGVNRTYCRDYFEKLKDKVAKSIIYVSPTLLEPEQTRLSIMSVVREPLTKIIGNPKVSNLLYKSTFNFNEIIDKRTAIFVLGRPENKLINKISEIFINQIIQYLVDTNIKRRCHIILDSIDDFDNLNDIASNLKLSNYYNIRFYIATYSVEDLNNRYMMKVNRFSDIIKINKDTIELESMGSTWKVSILISENDMYKREVNTNIQYPKMKDNKIKVFDLKECVVSKHQEREKEFINSIKPGLGDKINTNNKKIDYEKYENMIDKIVRNIESEKTEVNDNENNEQLKMIDNELFLDIPILKEFNINRNDGKIQNKIIDYSNGKGMSQQLISDGPLRPGETFEDRIKFLIDNTNNYTKQIHPLNTEKNIFFLKEFEGEFKFKVYVQDILFNIGDRINFNRLINAYFVEPKNGDFYRMTVAAESLPYPNENIKIGEISENDQLTQDLLAKMDCLMNNLKYKNDVITTVEIPDDIRNKTFSEADLNRIKKNIDILKKQNIPYNENMKLIPSETNTKLSDKKTVFNDLIRKFVLATFATTFIDDIDIKHYDFIYRKFDLQFNLNNILDEEDKKVLNDIRNGGFNVDKVKLGWLYEECSIYLWVLNLTNFPNQQYQCDVDMMSDLLFIRVDEEKKINIPSILFTKIYDRDKKILDLDKLQMRSYDEILEKADLLNRYRWALDDVRINKKDINLPLDSQIVEYQCEAIFDIINWDDGSFI